MSLVKISLPPDVTRSSKSVNYEKYLFKKDVNFEQKYYLCCIGITNLSKNDLIPQIVFILKGNEISFSDLIFYNFINKSQ